MDLIFQKLRKANLTLQPTKCHFAAQEVKYLGHIISEKGVEVDRAKIATVADFPQPRNVKQVRSFLGMCNYYRKFIKDYSNICAPLLNLLKKNIRFQWKPEHTDAFNILKRKLTTAPILAFPDFGKPFVLSIDASDTAVGYVLGQINSQGLENVIAFGGRALRDQEKRWHINHKEGLALIEAIKTFKAYLTSAEFTVFTDNITVRWLESTKDATGRLGRWALFLQQYKFKIQHRPGNRN